MLNNTPRIGALAIEPKLNRIDPRWHIPKIDRLQLASCGQRPDLITLDLTTEFIANHETVFVIEQNRDGQMRRLLINETSVSHPEKLVPVLNYDGLPITARQIASVIRATLGGTDNVTPIASKREASRKAKS